MLRVTRERVRASGFYYPEERVAALVPPEGLEPLRVMHLDVPYVDCVWLVLCASGMEPAEAFEFAVKEVALLPGAPPGWSEWAEGWLSGADRTEAASRRAESACLEGEEYVDSLQRLWLAAAARGVSPAAGWLGPVLTLAVMAVAYPNVREGSLSGTTCLNQRRRLLSFCEEIALRRLSRLREEVEE